MSDKTKQKTGFFKGVKTEFKKITWPTRNQLVKETIAVSVVTILLGAIIKLVDMVMQTGIAILIK
ncbi:MAG: preprotein translocase subunit SecE [Lachnospiraceae bacterium]|jgi:preprotein translocase subunit SecE|nr:preprotein translocase subunit SecE [Lachnospiraceae bacterium]MBQ6312465.1 preprotein translocase subunit SecE [Lachnospiraceae bacterium]MBQ6353811.1 preprotein translocase subunit SecE [Lachnospiraceae bacterium]MBR2752741.1 preprotein translocase subunit SecE [Lachnospiraceae bacterium]